MALLSQDPPLPGTASASADTALAELTQLLLRLQNNLLHPTPDRERRLRTSEYERAKTEAMAMDEDDSSDGEDLLGHIIPTPSESMDSRSSDTRDEHNALETPPNSSTTEPTPQEPIPRTPSPTPAGSSQPTTQTTQTLRSRSSARPTAASHTTARAALFANRPKPPEPQTTTATAEAILENQKAEQDDLSRSILQLASALKDSSKRFAVTLEADKDVLEKTGEGINKAEQGMRSAAGRMGKLRQMTEGKGWWGRMILYAWVYGLMLSLVLLVFLMPKLRF
ncbi:synaptobrevin [Metarhizium acridum CQMa 102]|uniref:Synaptobrevin n=1 Tax=Metarhizium acridum (strain CQMa 102) TaxID=655827 RepID=E9E5B4_METAQ|nr:synaptobrevin [Metarhizium acridum CQMa 102]EFY88896.1 synaptobrevin [Metarhizium acridum CQMa 102]